MAHPDEAHYRMISRKILAGAIVPFLGARVNLIGRPESVEWERGQYLPSGAELAEYLAQRVGYPFEDTRNLLRVSQYVDVMLGDGPLYRELHEVFDADYAPTPVHQLLAQIPAMVRARKSDKPRYFPLIVTTNYDDLLERAFKHASEEYDLVTYIADGPKAGKFLHTGPDGVAQVIVRPNSYSGLLFNQRPVIAKIQGAVGRGANDQDSFVITENQYIDYLSGTDIAQLIPVSIAKRMRQSHFLFLGCSLKDLNPRVILQRLWCDAAVEWPSWAVQLGPDTVEERSWNRRGVEVLDARLEDYIGGLSAVLTSAPAITGELL
jgi:hypothetical protein